MAITKYLLAAIASVTIAPGSVVTFTDRAAWTAAAGNATVADFTGSVADNQALFLQNPTTYDDFTFAPTGGSHLYVIGPALPTSPIPGVYDWGTGAVMMLNPTVYPTGNLSITFSGPARAFGLDFGVFGLGTEDVYDYGGPVHITLPDGTTVTASAADSKTFTFRGLVSSTPFSSVTLSIGANVRGIFDNISRDAPVIRSQTPEPATFAIVGIALVAISGLRRRA